MGRTVSGRPLAVFRPLFAVCALLAAGSAAADVNVGVIVSLTGPGASLGIPDDNTVTLWPTELGGQKINPIVLNDGTDSTSAAKNATRVITEDNVDIIVGPSSTPPSLAVIDVAARSGVPVILYAISRMRRITFCAMAGVACVWATSTASSPTTMPVFGSPSAVSA